MKIYVITDTHLGHEKLITMGQGRPADFTEQILENTKKTSGDLLIHLGDICIGDDKKWNQEFLFSARNFKKKILVRGNHDNKSDSWYYDQGWDFVCREFYNKFFGKMLLFTHIPLAKELISGIDFNIHGHFHGSAEKSHRFEGFMIGGGTYDKKIHRDFAPEIYGYKPILLETVLSKEILLPTI